MMKTTLIATLLAVPWLASATSVSPSTTADAVPHAQTRAEVREALHMARITGRLSPGGEIADPPEVLKAREDFNALQAEVQQSDAQDRQQQARRDELAERD